jgi:hypothetical protein
MQRQTGQRIDGLYKKLLASMYEDAAANRAKVIAERLARLLSRCRAMAGSIFMEECLSLVAEARGDLLLAIWHRANEIRLIRQLHKLTPDHQAGLVRTQYDEEDLQDRLNILAMLYHDIGDLGKAVETLQESQQLCAQYGLAFEGGDLLQEYMKERTATSFYLEMSENGALNGALTRIPESGSATGRPQEAKRQPQVASSYSIVRPKRPQPTTSPAS